jgi:hypothetical protein
MIEMTVTYEGLLRRKLIHWATVIFFSTNNNRTGKAFALSDFSVAALGSHLTIIIGMKMEKLGFNLTTKRYLARHNRNTKTDKDIRFHC